MAYNNYFPYQPYYQYPQYPQFQQQIQPQQTQQTYTPPVTSSGIIWVSGAMEAQSYPLAPNNAVALWEKSGKTIYLKQADATGKPSMTVYDLVERAETPSESADGKDGKNISYATKDDVAVLAGAVKSVNEVISSMKDDIDRMNGDLYGLSGKKRPAKKKDGEDDE